MNSINIYLAYISLEILINAIVVGPGDTLVIKNWIGICINIAILYLLEEEKYKSIANLVLIIIIGFSAIRTINNYFSQTIIEGNTNAILITNKKKQKHYEDEVHKDKQKKLLSIQKNNSKKKLHKLWQK